MTTDATIAPSGRRSARRIDAPQRRFRWSVLTPSVGYLLFFTLLPLVWVFALSLFNYSPRREGAGIGGLGGDNPFVGLFRRHRVRIRYGPPIDLSAFRGREKDKDAPQEASALIMRKILELAPGPDGDEAPAAR